MTTNEVMDIERKKMLYVQKRILTPKNLHS